MRLMNTIWEERNNEVVHEEELILRDTISTNEIMKLFTQSVGINF
jgi:hypothetical protein